MIRLRIRCSAYLFLLAILFCMNLLVPQYLATTVVQTPALTAESDDGWYYLPAYPNYAPCGLPDFDQKQDPNWQSSWGWSFCAPAALADVLWWFDSKHEDPLGIPGDGQDTYPLIRDYGAPGASTPGPQSDDHNFNNVNDVQTSWDGTRGSNKELIEQLAWYTNTNFCKNLFFDLSGTPNFFLKQGTKRWIRDAGLQQDYTIKIIPRPRFSTIVEHLQKNEGVLLRFIFYLPTNMNFLPKIARLSYHFVAVAGINPNGSIALSDPEWDNTNHTSDPTLHNDAGIVSHDIYQVNFTSPYPLLGSWWIPTYASHRRVVITHAVIISEKE
jgi:hypothetical protein